MEQGLLSVKDLWCKAQGYMNRPGFELTPRGCPLLEVRFVIGRLKNSRMNEATLPVPEQPPSVGVTRRREWKSGSVELSCFEQNPRLR